MMPEALVEPWQPYTANGETEDKMLVAAMNLLELNLMTSQPLFQGKLVQLPLPDKMKVFNHGSRHLQYIRSTPSRCVLSTLVGMKDIRHVNYNLEVTKVEPLNREEWFELMKPGKRDIHVEQGA